MALRRSKRARGLFQQIEACCVNTRQAMDLVDQGVEMYQAIDDLATKREAHTRMKVTARAFRDAVWGIDQALELLERIQDGTRRFTGHNQGPAG